MYKELKRPTGILVGDEPVIHLGNAPRLQNKRVGIRNAYKITRPAFNEPDWQPSVNLGNDFFEQLQDKQHGIKVRFSDETLKKIGGDHTMGIRKQIYAINNKLRESKHLELANVQAFESSLADALSNLKIEQWENQALYKSLVDSLQRIRKKEDESEVVHKFEIKYRFWTSKMVKEMTKESSRLVIALIKLSETFVTHRKLRNPERPLIVYDSKSGRPKSAPANNLKTVFTRDIFKDYIYDAMNGDIVTRKLAYDRYKDSGSHNLEIAFENDEQDYDQFVDDLPDEDLEDVKNVKDVKDVKDAKDVIDKKEIDAAVRNLSKSAKKRRKEKIKKEKAAQKARDAQKAKDAQRIMESINRRQKAESSIAETPDKKRRP